MKNEYHYPPDLLQLLVDTIPVLCRSKQDVITFFASAGVDDHVLGDLKRQLREKKEMISKYAIVRIVLGQLNEGGDQKLAERQTVLKRVVEWRDFSVCFPDVQQKAEDLVRRVRILVDKKDTTTGSKQAEESARTVDFLLKQQEILKRKRELTEILRSLTELCKHPNHQTRGKMLEGIFNQYCKVSGILIREAFTLKGIQGNGILEQIDGVVEIDGPYYLVEMKWFQHPIGVAEISQHMDRLYSRSHVHGIFLSASGYTGPAIERCRDALQQKLIVLCELQEIIVLLEQEKLLKEFLKVKIRAAVIDKNPLYYPLIADTI